jgi:hypothetical protein
MVVTSSSMLKRSFHTLKRNSISLGWAARYPKIIFRTWSLNPAPTTPETLSNTILTSNVILNKTLLDLVQPTISAISAPKRALKLWLTRVKQ